MPTSLAAVVFDLDGTLFDHLGSATRGVAGLVAHIGGEFAPSHAEAWFAAEDRHVQSWATGQCDWQEQRRRRLRDFLPLVTTPPVADDELDHLFDVYLDHYQRSWHAFDDAASALNAARAAGYKVAVLTNGQRQQQIAKLRRCDLIDLVGPIWATDDLPAPKPDRRSYLSVCSHLRTDPAETVYVGDNFVHDVEGATAAGLQAVFLDRSDTGPIHHQPRISGLANLPEALRHLESQSKMNTTAL